MHQCLIRACMLSAIATSVFASDETAEPTHTPQNVALSTLAQTHDFVGIVQVDSIDYAHVRGFPKLGQANLRVVIPYKGGLQEGTFITVKEEGLEPENCYYPDILASEGARFLAFLNKAEDTDHYEGSKPACQLPILVNQHAQYALRYPIDGIELNAELAQDMMFHDPYAWEDISEATTTRIAELKEKYFAVEPATSSDDPFAPPVTELRYSKGIPIWDVRPLIFGDRKVFETNQ